MISTRSSEKNRGQVRFCATVDGDGRRHHEVIFRGAHDRVDDVVLEALLDEDDVVAEYALQLNDSGELVHPICQVRLGYRIIRGRRRWFAQLVFEGEPYRKPRDPIAIGPVGVDAGAKHIAVVAPDAHYASIERLNANVERSLKQLATVERRRARAQDRSRRATNPEAFDERGCYIRGARIRVRSKRYRELGAERREAQRRAGETKRQQSNALANRVIELGTDIRLEDLSYRAWQRAGMGGTMLASTPGRFVTALRAAAGKYHRDLVLIDARVAKLSQLCPLCGRYRKTEIRGAIERRMSACVCGRLPVQRDLLAAFLASLCDAGGTLDATRAKSAWERLSRVLSVAASSEEEPRRMLQRLFRTSWTTRRHHVEARG